MKMQSENESTTVASGTSASALENINVQKTEVLVTPEQLKARLPVDQGTREFVTRSRESIREIVTGRDPRLLVVIGPCSIHCPDEALEYARKLKPLHDEMSDRLFIVMRAYFEKPRSTVGWKGLLNDPYLDDSFQVGEGLNIARQLLLGISEIGLPIATEALDPITPQYLQDLISWSAIGARTTESQTHREMASGLSCPVGFKNGTDGGLDVAINALQSVVSPHRFLGINSAGQVSVVHTHGNAHGHVVLRGGSNGPNYTAEHVETAAAALQAVGHHPSVMIDCSHANSAKNYKNQPFVLEDIIEQIAGGCQTITGVMIESNLVEGQQKLSDDLAYGVSVTDACVGWDTSIEMLENLHQGLASRF